MSGGLDVSGVVNVTVTISPLAVPVRNFGVPLFIGASDVIDVYERRRQYASLDEVGDDFASNSNEYKAAAAFFAQEPQPSLAYIGRWAQSPTHALLYGGVLLPAEQLIANFTSITAGAMFLYMDGVPTTVSGVNLAAQTNLNGVAAQVQTALAAQLADTTCVWNATQGRFVVTSGTSGPTSTLSWAAAPTAWGSVSFSLKPSNNDSLIINGTTVTFVTGTPGALEIQIGATLLETLQNAVAMLGQSADANLNDCIYSYDATHLYIVSAVTGTAGNNISLAEGVDSGGVMTLGHLSGGNLSGGSGDDLATAMKLTSAASAPIPVNGVAAETALECISHHMEGSHAWYAAQFVDNNLLLDADHEACAVAIEGASPKRTYWYTTGNSLVLDNQTQADLASAMKTLNLARTCGLFSTTSAVAVASLFGRFATVDFRQNNACITAKFKRLPGISAETLSETQAATVRAKRINTFVNYDNDTAIIQEGVMADGSFIDERIGCDWLQNALQVALFNVLYTTPTKVPQTEAGVDLLIAACKTVCQQAVFNGFVAPGQYNGPTIGQLKSGDILTTGFYIFAPPITSQSQADREARRSVPISVVVKLSGAVHSVVCSVYVNR
jgi:hypothetical protein